MIFDKKPVEKFALFKRKRTFVPRFRGVAQPGLEYSSGGRVVGSSNLLTPTEWKG